MKGVWRPSCFTAAALPQAQKWKTWAEKERETRQKLEDELKAHSSKAETTSKHEEEMAAVSKVRSGVGAPMKAPRANNNTGAAGIG